MSATQARDEAPAAEHWHALESGDVLARLDSTRKGLTRDEALARLARHGRNEIPAAPGRSSLARFAAQFDNLLVQVLIVAGVITVFMGHLTDAAVIFGVVVINAVIGFIQEGRAERALEAVRAMLADDANVLRGGVRQRIAAAELVPGDLVLLASGDRVPADLRLVRTRNLRVDEAALTGESVPVDKGEPAVAADCALGDRTSVAYSGTTVTFGQASGVVVETGARTELGRIGGLVASVTELATPLTRKLDQLARRLTLFILVGAVLTFLFGRYVHGFEVAEIFLAVVGLAVSAIPEGLPAVVTIALAIGTQRMAHRSAIVRRLPAVETLGSVTVICTDKTGTLTRNEMTVARVATPRATYAVSGTGYAPEGAFQEDGDDGAPVDPAARDDLVEFARCALLCNDARLWSEGGVWRLAGGPTEGALLAFAAKSGVDTAELNAELPRVDEIPFESEHRFMATLHRDARGHGVVYLKGAPERVLELCADDGEGSVDRDAWRARIDAMARDGLRVLALATASLSEGETTLHHGHIDRRFRLLGMAGMIDPPREEAIDAVAKCRDAGISVKMITGDHAVTAAAIAARLGLSVGKPLTGPEIDATADDALAARLADTDVIARASPEHKLRLVAALQARGDIVSMTGDGVNDAPALKAADVGVAMGCKGTDAAKEAAAVVLADDNFATIAQAVREGRTIFDNIKKSLLFILPTNGGEAGVILLAVFLGVALPVTAVQILWVNMVTTVTLAVALAFEPPERGVMSRPPRPPSEPIITRLLLARVLYVTLLLTTMTFWLFGYELGRGLSLEAARTSAVNMLVIGELVYLFNCRRFTAHSFGRDTLLGNPVAFWAALALIALQIAFTYAEPLQQLFGTSAMDATSWALVAGLSAVKYLAVEAEKAVLRRLGFARL